ncbi:MAG: hypothetical protein NZ765_08145 [Anaerolineae bacterium]|nr:hypothetical protein [Anaerolineae bacterium]
MVSKDAKLLQHRLVEQVVRRGRLHRLGEGQPRGGVSGARAACAITHSRTA